MISNLVHRRALGSVFAVLLSWAALAGVAQAPAASASPSPYPAGATRPALRPRASEFARAASSSGGSQAPGGAVTPPSTPAKPAKPTKSTKPKKPKKPVLHGNPARALAAL